MLSRRVLAARPLSQRLLQVPSTRSFTSTVRRQADDIDTDPDLNGGYKNPPRVKRQHRDPYAKWWDQQERRNYGEPIHEDNDVLGMFTTEDYTWTTPRWGWVLMGTFCASVAGLCFVVKATYPDKPSVPREFNLEKELGGKEAYARPRMRLEEPGAY